jgi:NADH-quinone oxidoreductase subunit C
MQTPEQIKERILTAIPGAAVEMGPASSLLVDRAHGRAVAEFLRDDAELQFDFASNVTGVDWVKLGCLEAVYHLYSMALGHGPLVIRLRTENRSDKVLLPSLTLVWRSCELQEREVFDLFGIIFEGHPDLRRILMWDEFTDYPMRKDYAAPAAGEVTP